jgi:hypothetical protein
MKLKFEQMYQGSLSGWDPDADFEQTGIGFWPEAHMSLDSEDEFYCSEYYLGALQYNGAVAIVACDREFVDEWDSMRHPNELIDTLRDAFKDVL